MKLRKLFKNIEYRTIKGSQEIEINGICSDSRYVAPGNLFIAKKGEKYDGADFIPNAVAAGAVAVVTDLYDPYLKVVQVIHDDVNSIEADIASNYFNFPSKSLFMVGVTGTNGKTTISYLIKHLFESGKKKSGLLGTIEYILGNNELPSSLTTPDNLLIQKYLREMISSGCTHAVLEVSSHGMEQNRLKNIDFDIAIFSNLSQDHLDYHDNLENYSDAKKKLFDSLAPSGVAVVNIDDEWSAKMIETTKAKIITYGIKNKQADFFAKNIKFSLDGVEFDLIYKDIKEKITSPLIGRFNVYNILAAVAAANAAEIPLDQIIKYLSSFQSARGRLERVKTDRNFYLFVDFAHTPDALKNVLQTLKEIKHHKIITVFGCGGDRDKGKRPLMGKICSQFSDLSVITSDNPRSEEPGKIISEIEKGFIKKNYFIEEDRSKAIEKALSLAEEKDIVLVAGKGHETTQIFANKTLLFNDREIAKKILGKNR
jgi:UDP-N-acetylmuramoyl-L-alanyl-D-glutamate--2,6-diaminopimelate ligase